MTSSTCWSAFLNGGVTPVSKNRWASIASALAAITSRASAMALFLSPGTSGASNPSKSSIFSSSFSSSSWSPSFSNSSSSSSSPPNPFSFNSSSLSMSSRRSLGNSSSSILSTFSSIGISRGAPSSVTLNPLSAGSSISDGSSIFPIFSRISSNSIFSKRSSSSGSFGGGPSFSNLKGKSLVSSSPPSTDRTSPSSAATFSSSPSFSHDSNEGISPKGSAFPGTMKSSMLIFDSGSSTTSSTTSRRSMTSSSSSSFPPV